MNTTVLIAHSYLYTYAYLYIYTRLISFKKGKLSAKWFSFRRVDLIKN
jgi:hypothetical protein